MAKISQLAKPLAEVHVFPKDDGSHKIKVCFEVDRSGFPNLNTVLAIDASDSMKGFMAMAWSSIIWRQ